MQSLLKARQLRRISPSLSLRMLPRHLLRWTLKHCARKLLDVLRSIYDPEIPVNIYEIGLIYSVDIDPANAVNIRMTLTSPACPAAGTLPGEVEDKTRRVEGVTDVKVDLVWDPTWTPAMMSETAKLQLGML